jgi:exopolyphosphatase/pppGpp-phosphohydrolase
VTGPRAQTLLGGTLVLCEIARLVETDLELGRGGLREGAALALARAEAVAA